MIHLWIQERSKESRVELGGEATDLIRRSWNIAQRFGDFEQKKSFSRRVVPHLDAVVKHFYRKPGISEAILTPPTVSETPSADISAGTNDTIYGYIQWLRSTWHSRAVADCTLPIYVRQYDYLLPWWQSMHSLGKIYTFQGLEKKAEALYRATLAEVWSMLPREHCHAIEVVEDLAWSISKQNRFDESLQWHRWALNSRAKNYGGMKQEFLMYKIGSVLESQGNHDEALIYYRTAVEKIDKEFRTSNPRKFRHISIRIFRSIANILQSRGNSESILWREREFEFLNESPYYEPFDVCQSSLGVTTSLIKFGEYEKAKEWAAKSFELYRSLEPDSMTNPLHFALKIWLHKAAGEIYLRLHEYEEALRLNNVLLSFLLSATEQHFLLSKPVKLLREHDFHTLPDLLFSSGYACFKLERYEEAFGWLSRALETHESSMESTRLLDTHEMMGESLAELKRWDEAAVVLQVSLLWREFTFGVEHEHTRTTLHRLAFAEFKSARYDESLTHWRRLLVDTIRALNDDHPDVLNTLGHLGRVHLELEQYDEAFHLLTAALEGNRRYLNHDRPIVLDAMRDISLLYWRQKNYAKAFDWIHTAVSADTDDYLKCLNLLEDFQSITIHNLGRNVEELRLLCEQNSKTKSRSALTQSALPFEP